VSGRDTNRAASNFDKPALAQADAQFRQSEFLSRKDKPMSITSVFRVDSFFVPSASQSEFMARVQRTRLALEGMDGCKTNWILQGPDEPGGSRVVTIAEWESPAAFDAAKDAMTKKYAEEGFHPPAFIRSLKIEANLGEYVAV
jgi:heme-degrading monooxygenase HmoA